MDWEYSESGDYWCASRPMPDGACSFIYEIYPMLGGGYTAEASNNAYGACRVAVKNTKCKKASVFHSLSNLMKKIENNEIYWLYVSHCNCVGEVTKEER